jgi:hypothetical protein
LDVERYRTSYAPALLLTLVIMTAFVIGFCEQLFRREKMEAQQPRETDNT